jgi:hypothetical protein
MFRIYNWLYLENFKIKKTKKWYKITVLNWFNDFVYCKNKNDLLKLYKISNEYCINRDKQNIIEYMNNN